MNVALMFMLNIMLHLCLNLPCLPVFKYELNNDDRWKTQQVVLKVACRCSEGPAKQAPWHHLLQVGLGYCKPGQTHQASSEQVQQMAPGGLAGWRLKRASRKRHLLGTNQKRNKNKRGNSLGGKRHLRILFINTCNICRKIPLSNKWSGLNAPGIEIPLSDSGCENCIFPFSVFPCLGQ